MKTTLALLCGGISMEDYLSRRSCEVLYQELNKEKFNIFVLDWQRDGTVVRSKMNIPDEIEVIHDSILHSFADFQGDIVVNLIHGERENCGEIQGLLELAQIPYTGNGLSSSVIGMNKILTKRCFRECGINCPPEFLFQPKKKEDWSDLLTDFRSAALQYPLILKPVKGGSSVGIHLVQNEKDLTDFLDSSYNGTPYFFEEFVKGEEYSIGIFATRNCDTPLILPTARINHEGDYFDATIKYDDTYWVDFPDKLEPSLVKAMQEAAINTHKAIGFNGFSRCDFIVRDNDYFALEVNTHPGMSSYSIVPNMVSHAQLSLGDLFEQMIVEVLETNFN